jgi:transposase
MTTSTAPKRDFDHLEQRRLMAAKYFAQGFSKADVSRQLSVSFASVRRWHRAWLDRGEAGLGKTGRPGRKPRISDADLERIREAVRVSPVAHGFTATRWTIKRVHALVLQITGAGFNPEHLRRLLNKAGIEWKATPPTIPAFQEESAVDPRFATVVPGGPLPPHIELFSPEVRPSFRPDSNDRSGFIPQPTVGGLLGGSAPDRGGRVV